MNELIVHFVGLCLFVAASNGTGVDVVMPNVTSTHHATHEVDPHRTVIAVHKDDLVSATNWASTVLPAGAGMPGFVFFDLAGEDLSFGGMEMKTKASLPHQLPHLEYGCNKASLAPNARTTAAALVRVPYGNLCACQAQIGTSDPRIDTRLKLRNKYGVSLYGAKNKRWIHLKPDAEILIGNVPAKWIAGETVLPQSEVSHYPAYYSLLETATGCTQQQPRPGITDCDSYAGDPPTMISGGTDPQALNQTTSPTPPTQPLPPTKPARFLAKSLKFMSGQCSNSQYP